MSQDDKKKSSVFPDAGSKLHLLFGGDDSVFISIGGLEADDDICPEEQILEMLFSISRKVHGWSDFEELDPYMDGEERAELDLLDDQIDKNFRVVCSEGIPLDVQTEDDEFFSASNKIDDLYLTLLLRLKGPRDINSIYQSLPIQLRAACSPEGAMSARLITLANLIEEDWQNNRSSLEAAGQNDMPDVETP